MENLTRRSFVKTAAVALGAAFMPGAVTVARAQVELPWTTIGYSQGGEPLTIYHLGDGPFRVLILGGQHGGPEQNTIHLVQLLTNYFGEHREQLPEGVGLDILPVANPDGVTYGSRQYLSGVDPNRNWGGGDWSADAYDSNGVFRAGLGGPEPFSEQETRALAGWLLANKPSLVINYHSAGGFMFGPREGHGAALTEAYSAASRYPTPTPGAGRSPLPYRATGSTNVWMRQMGMPGLFIELTTPYYPELDRNLAGLRAVLPLVGASA